jgi:aspartyl-tRNA(Asn)/glutamyl-tRNA(Gln) amidotransferase subunit A
LKNLRTIRELSRSFAEGTSGPVEATEQALERIDALGQKLGAFITVLRESAKAQAAESESRLRGGRSLGPLDGVPIAVKDLIYIKGVRCTAGSKILAGNVATYDAPVVSRLKSAGAVIVGTTNLHEFACGVTSVNPHYGPVRNPWDTGRIAGGSSGGSAVAVAAGLAAGALGTDTAGSVRIPAALCGVMGLKPTYGRVSRLGVVPLSQSLDTVGTLNACAWDAAAMLGAVAGHSEGDMTTTHDGVPDYISGLRKAFEGARIGVPRKFFAGLLEPAVEEAFEGFLARLVKAGCSVEDSDLEGIEETYGRWLPIRRAEATAFHMKWLEKYPDLYGKDVRRLLEMGKEVLAVDYVSAVNSRPGLMERLASSMSGFDAFAVPTTCAAAPKIGEEALAIGGKEVEVYSAMTRLTLPFNFVGFPAMSVPAGGAGGLPVGAQLVSKPFDEASLFRIASALEERFGLPPAPEPA